MRYRLLVVNLILLCTLTVSLRGRDLERITVEENDFLASLVLPFRGWKVKEVPLSPSDRDLLEPDSVLVRRYLSPGLEYAELAVIAGHRKKTVHTPGFCMTGSGWELLSQEPATLNLAGRTIPAVRTVLARDGERLMATYFFTNGADSTRSLGRFILQQTLARFHNAIPLGAVVRILVPMDDADIDATKLTDEFAAATLPAVLKKLHETRLTVRS